jgi:hypothetical protein
VTPTRHFAVAALAATLALPALAEGPVVVELFTSQGCSSCPPADDFLAELAADPDVIALALHVDYWDYIGWKDSFAQASFTERQKTYARAIGSRLIYTPQMIVGGLDRVEGNDPEAVRALIRAHRMVDRGVSLAVTRKDGLLRIDATAEPALPSGAEVVVVRFLSERTVDIGDGENAGHSVTYRNIVTDWTTVFDWPGTAPLSVEVPIRGDDPAVVLLQEPGPQAMLAAARVD